MSDTSGYAYLHKYRSQDVKARPIAGSTLIITATILMYVLQVTYPELLEALRLNVDDLKAGEWWRLVTPIFVQPHGVFQFLFNMMFLIAFLPIAERIYGSRIWILYLASGVVGQLVNSAWKPGGGGASTAVFGVMGSLLVYVLWYRKGAPTQYPIFATLGILGAVVMIFTHDGHGPGLLTGAALAALICLLSPPERPNNALQVTCEDARA